MPPTPDPSSPSPLTVRWRCCIIQNVWAGRTAAGRGSPRTKAEEAERRCAGVAASLLLSRHKCRPHYLGLGGSEGLAGLGRRCCCCWRAVRGRVACARLVTAAVPQYHLQEGLTGSFLITIGSLPKLWHTQRDMSPSVGPERLFPAVAMIGLNHLRRHLSAPDGSLLGTTGEEGDRRDLCHSSDESCRPALLCNAEPYQPDRSMETIHTINNLVLPITDYTQSRQCFRFGSVKLKHMCCSMYVICVYVLLSIDEHRSCPPAQFLS